MIKTFRDLFRSSLALLLAISLVACSGNSGTSGLEPFTSPDGRYGFLYPIGWVKVAIKDGPEVVFHDLINSDETLSLVISKLGNQVDLEDLGGAESVADRLIKELVDTNDNGKEVTLIETKSREKSNHTFYDLEYSVDFSGRSGRHELATVVVDRGYLYTFSAGSSDSRWPKVKELYEKVLGSFTFLI